MLAKAKKSLVFVELLSDFPREDESVSYDKSLVDDHIFLIDSYDLWYENIIVYLQTTKFSSNTSREERRRICHHAKYYPIVNDTLYRRGVDSILRRCLTHNKAEKVLNDFHGGACGGHLFEMAIAQKILRVGYYWPSIFKDGVEAVKRCHPCQVFTMKMCSHPAPMFLVITINPFAKWGIDFTTCHPTSALGHKYIIVAIDYFTKWAETMMTFSNDGKTAAGFTFNQIIARFGDPKQIVTNHGSHFQNSMMTELST